jgi:hypothetical protein
MTFDVGLFACLLFYFLAGHALADFSLQSDTMAKGKHVWLNTGPVPWAYWMLAHSLIHGLVVALVVLGAYPESAWHDRGHVALALGVWETVAHFVIDLLKCDDDTNIHQDQALHALCKLMYAVLVAAIV